MNVEDFIDILGSDFYAGVPDSLLKPLCDFLIDKYGEGNKNHVIAANEGNAVAVAAGYYLSTGKVPVIYMQNSGQGNIINPIVSLLNNHVYAIPELFVIGWRGEPNIKDEPQHLYQGEITLSLLDAVDVTYFVLKENTKADEFIDTMGKFRELFGKGKSAAIVVSQNALNYSCKNAYTNSYMMRREDVIKEIISVSGDSPIISTTGKASRELFELRESDAVRERNVSVHSKDFLTVGSMGHSSSIALGVALQTSGKDVWCIDGDGAAIMHMGAMAVIGKIHPENFIHIVINNEAHESVGGAPTAASNIDFVSIAKACNYDYAVSVDCMDDLKTVLYEYKCKRGLRFLEVKSAVGSRRDLGRPTLSPSENKTIFMDFLKSCM